MKAVTRWLANLTVLPLVYGLLVCGLLVLSGCGVPDQSSGNPSGDPVTPASVNLSAGLSKGAITKPDDATKQRAALDYQRGIVRLALKTEPPTLNSLKVSDAISGFVLTHTNEGLMRYDEQLQLVGGVAERWQLTAQGARFHLRKNARWSDGQPVTAADFVYAWQRMVDPASAGPYAFIMFPVRHARAISEGTMAPEALGVKAIGTHELEVTFEQPCPYFLSLTTFVGYFPLKESFHRAQGLRYASEASRLLSNGPFILTRWVHGAALQLDKNPHYWDADNIALNGLHIDHVTSDQSALYNLYKDGAIAYTTLATDALEDALQQGYPLHQFATGGLGFLRFNLQEGRATAELLLRQAIQQVLNGDVVANRILALPGTRPARSVFPYTVGGIKAPLIEEFPPTPIRADLDQARALMQQYLSHTSRTKPPSLVLLCSDNPESVRIAQYIQNLLSRALGIDVRLDRQIFKQRLQKARDGQFDMVLATWLPDFDDPMTFADLFASWNDNNRGRYHQPRYDQWVEQAQQETDPEKRMALMDKLQHQLQQDVPLIPLYERAEVYLVHPDLKGVRRQRFGGDPAFRDAWIATPL